MRVGILGAGAFGTALAISFSKKFHVTLYSCCENHVSEMRKTRINEYFSNFKILDNIDIKTIHKVNDICVNDTCTDSTCINSICIDNTCTDSTLFWTFPVGPSLEILKNLDFKNLDFKSPIRRTPIIIGSKGLLDNGKLMSDIFSEYFSDVLYMSGPMFAHEIANFERSYADLACKDIEIAKKFADILSSDYLKFYPTSDMIAPQVFGAMKNVMAIGSGIIHGLTDSANTKAAFISLATREMEIFGKSMGAKNILNLSGIGDLILTMTNKTSRNFSLGYNLVTTKQSVIDLINNSKAVCEGYYTVAQIYKILNKLSIVLPITMTVYKILYESANIETIFDIFNKS